MLMTKTLWLACQKIVERGDDIKTPTADYFRKHRDADIYIAGPEDDPHLENKGGTWTTTLHIQNLPLPHLERDGTLYNAWKIELQKFETQLKKVEAQHLAHPGR